MKIYSWNVFCFNKKLNEVTKYISTLDFDVLCLQEVTPQLLAKLKQLPFHITYHIDVLRLYKKDAVEMNYVVLLSKHELRSHGTLQFADFPFPLYTRAIIRTMEYFKWSWIAERGAVYADIKIGTQLVRIFSIHLTLWGPGNRAEEFKLLANSLPKGQAAIICGDFNVIEYGPMKLTNILLGASIRQSTPWYPERKLFEALFTTYGLRNPLRGKVTHAFSRSQLDHILVTKEIRIQNAWVEKETHGSDHLPVAIQIEENFEKGTKNKLLPHSNINR
jgi:endonuclease/exonuclease/phosphatase family metal-dependent hydrolase